MKESRRSPICFEGGRDVGGIVRLWGGGVKWGKMRGVNRKVADIGRRDSGGVGDDDDDDREEERRFGISEGVG